VEQLTYLQSIVIGLVQGFSELFPISSLGHSVLIPAWLGGDWQRLVEQQSQTESPYLAFIVGLHVATALALLLLYRRDWALIVVGFVRSIRFRRVSTVHERMAWMIILATIPVGILGLLLEHELRTLFAKPFAAACFLTLNGFVLLLGERLRRRAKGAAADRRDADREARPHQGDQGVDRDAGDLDTQISGRIRSGDALAIGGLQSAALLAGISRSGITMVGGLLRGLSHEEAVRFAFLLATPVILAAGLYKVPDLFGPLGNGIRGQVVAGSVAAFFASLAAATFLVRWFRTRTLTPFAVYCLVFGGISLVHFA
jgi:undecaprenyl-diphosphatase